MSLLRQSIVVLVALPAVTCAVAAVAAHGGRFGNRLDVLTHFAPLYLAGGVLAVVAGSLLGRLALPYVVLPGLVTVAASLALMAPEFAPRSGGMAAHGEERLKVIQFNAWGGNEKVDAALKWILAENPDIVVLEEGGHIGARLAAEGGYHRACRPCFATLYSKAPPLSENSPRRGQVGRSPVSMATYRSPSGPFTVVGVHRSWPTKLAKSEEQTRALHEILTKVSLSRTIVAGDFNSTPWSFARRAEDATLGLSRRTRAVFSWPAERVSHNRVPIPFPVLPIDHVYAGPGWVTVDVRRGPRLGSDHYPVVVTLAPSADPQAPQ